MAAITTRVTAGSGATVKGSPLTNAEVDQNFINLNTAKLETSGGTVTGNLSVNGNTTLGDAAGDSVTVNGATSTFVAASTRIQGDFSNATIVNRAALQSSTTNGNTTVAAIPNGTGTAASFTALNSSGMTNSSGAQLVVTATEAQLRSEVFGTGTALPLVFYANGSEAGRFATDGQFTANAGVNTTNIDLSTSTPSAPASDHTKIFSRSVGGRIMPAFIGPSGLDASLQPLLARNRVTYVLPNANTTTLNTLGAALTATGTATAAAMATTNIYTRLRRLEYLVTPAAATAVAGFYQAQLDQCIGTSSVYGGFQLIVRFGPATGVATATRRLFVGMSNSVAAPTDVNPSTLLNMVGVGYDAADTNMQIMHNDGTGTATKIDLGANFPRPSADRTKAYELVLFNPPNSSLINYLVTDLGTEQTASGTINSADIPAAGTFLAPRGYSSVGGTSSVTGLALVSLYLESDY